MIVVVDIGSEVFDFGKTNKNTNEGDIIVYCDSEVLSIITQNIGF